jgi:hypothetical protein
MQNCQYIYDAEPSLSDGHVSWKEFISTINHKTKAESALKRLENARKTNI